MTGALLDEQLQDSTLISFEREFPELSAPDLATLAAIYRERVAYAADGLSPDAVTKELAKTDNAINALLDRLWNMSDEEGDAIAFAGAGRGASDSRMQLIERLRAYRNDVWVAERMADNIRRGRPPGHLRWLVEALVKRFEAAGLPVDPTQRGRLVRAVCIVLSAANDERGKDPTQLKSLSGSVRAVLRELGKNN